MCIEKCFQSQKQYREIVRWQSTAKKSYTIKTACSRRLKSSRARFTGNKREILAISSMIDMFNNERLRGILGSWIQPVPVLDSTAIWEINKCGISFFPSVLSSPAPPTHTLCLSQTWKKKLLFLNENLTGRWNLFYIHANNWFRS